MLNQISRTELLIGEDGLNKLKESKVAVFGIGGVGGYVVEALVRSGIGSIDLIDSDKFSITNLNRQLYATRKTLGLYKVDVAKDRILDICPDVNVNVFKTFYMPENSVLFDFSKYDYIIDAIDTVIGKIELIVNAKKNNTPIICSMGAGNKMHPEMFEIADISKTSVCPLAKVMRLELKKRKIRNVKVVFSKEPPIKTFYTENIGNTNMLEKSNSGQKIHNFVKKVPGSNSFVPAVAGLIIAGEVIKDLIKS